MDDIVSKSFVMNSFIVWLMEIVVYCTGVFLHIKIITISKREKELTWKLDITNSILTIAHFTNTLGIYIITYAVEDLYIFTGKWFCYVLKETRYLGALSTTGHSLVISMMKYVHIVHWEKTREFDKEKVIEIFFWAHLLHPIFTLIFHLIVTPDFIWAHDAYKEIDMCLGDPDNHWGLDSNISQSKYHDLCEIGGNPDDSSITYVLYVGRSGLCWIQTIFIYLVGLDIFEALFYFLIFRFMQR